MSLSATKRLLTLSSQSFQKQVAALQTQFLELRRTNPNILQFEQKLHVYYQRVHHLYNQPRSEQIQQISQQLNDITGYSGIIQLKQRVHLQEKAFSESRTHLQHAQVRYQNAVTSRSQCQRDINNLLQRKHTWTPSDVVAFTTLHQQELELAKAEDSARSTYQQAEANVNEAQRDLMSAIRQQYQEEQTWSDKIRRASTYGTLIIMGCNVLLFTVHGLWLEPRRREKMVKKMEAIVVSEVGKVRTDFQDQIALLNSATVDEEESKTPKYETSVIQDALLQNLHSEMDQPKNSRSEPILSEEYNMHSNEDGLEVEQIQTEVALTSPEDGEMFEETLPEMTETFTIETISTSHSSPHKLVEFIHHSPEVVMGATFVGGVIMGATASLFLRLGR
jgi:sensitive to high expression protein 9